MSGKAGSTKKKGSVKKVALALKKKIASVKKALTKKTAKPAPKAAKKPLKAPPKKPELTKAQLKAAQKAEKAALSAAKALESQKAEFKKVMTAPLQAFLNLWKPKTESFEAGLHHFLEHYHIPQKDRFEAEINLTDKLSTAMRKEPLPAAVLEQLMERFPKDRIHKMASIWSMKPRATIRLNILKADILGFAGSEAAKILKAKRGALSPWSFELNRIEDALTHPAYERGLIEFQDEASQLIALLANARPGQRILDLCTTDGQKALAMSAMMKNKGSLFVYDSDPKKLKTFKEKATRAGIDNYRILTDGQIAEVKSLDTVVIDAPSTGLGLLGSHPELKWKFHKEDLPRIHRLQAALLREGARKLKLGGYLIYATSTLNKSENEQQIEHFLKTTHNSYRLVPALSYINECITPYVNNFFNFTWNEKTLTSLGEFDPYFFMSPDVHGSSGVFAAVIQRVRIST